MVTGHSARECLARQDDQGMIRDVLKKSAKSVTEFDEPVWKGALGIDACLCARVQEIHFAIVGHVGRER